MVFPARIIKSLCFLLLIFAPSFAFGEDLDGLTQKLRARTAELDSTTSFYTDSSAKLWLNQGQDKVYRFTGAVKKRTSVTYSVDSNGYAMPSDYVGLNPQSGIVVNTTGQKWEPAFENPGFRIDTGAFQYYIDWVTNDSAEVFFKGRHFYDGQTINISYFSKPADMDTLTDSCEIDSKLQVYVIEQAMVFYLWSERMYGPASTLQQFIYGELGIGVKQGESP